jgi:perosamine synthetase
VEDDFPLSRDELMVHLRQNNIDSRPFFYPVHTMPPFSQTQEKPVAEKLSRQGINLPSAVTLELEDIQRVVKAISE